MDCEVLQQAIDRVADWATGNRMFLSEAKCVVLKRKPHPFRHKVSGVFLDEPLSVRDLGLAIKPNLHLKRHIIDTARASSAICNLIFVRFACLQ